MPHFAIGKLVEFHYQKDGHGVHGFGRLVSKEVIKPNLIKYTIKAGDNEHVCFNKEIKKLK